MRPTFQEKLGIASWSAFESFLGFPKTSLIFLWDDSFRGLSRGKGPFFLVFPMLPGPFALGSSLEAIARLPSFSSSSSEASPSGTMLSLPCFFRLPAVPGDCLGLFSELLCLVEMATTCLSDSWTAGGFGGKKMLSRLERKMLESWVQVDRQISSSL